MLRGCSLLVLLFFVFIQSAQAQVPSNFSYQGLLRDAGGEPLTGSYNFLFEIYETETGGSYIWQEHQHGIDVQDGIFNVILGDTSSLSNIAFDKQYWLGVTVNEGVELLPRTKLTSVPYAIMTAGGGGLTLPFSATYNGNGTIFDLVNSGIGNCGDFGISNPSSSGDAIYAWTVGDGAAVYGLNNSGNGYAGYFNGDVHITGALSGVNMGLTLPFDAIYNGGNYAFSISSQGTGGIANFYIPSNDATVLYALTDGDGIAGRFKSTSSSANSAVDISSWSNVAPALEVYNAGSGNAANFDGDVDINGTLSKSGGSFKIDHPLDPENKYLYHSFVESPDMMNVYNGNIILNNNGDAIVVLPEWFEALNMEFRYQLTSIGGYAPVYIAEEISNNSFKISGGTSGMKISWQVTGIRQDPFANQNRIQVEVEKPVKERGYYLHYKEYNQPIAKSIVAVKNPDLLTEVK